MTGFEFYWYTLRMKIAAWLLPDGWVVADEAALRATKREGEE